MEDTKSLLMMVLHKIFESQPRTIENTFQLIHSFNNGKIEKTNYERTLKAICDLMNDELPSPILGYILTLVDMPEDLDIQSPLIEKMKKTHDYLPEINVRSHLVEFLNNIKPCPAAIKNKSVDATVDTVEMKKDTSACTSQDFVKPKLLKRSRKCPSKTLGNVNSLLDICAGYVVNNEEKLKQMYKTRLATAWKLIYMDVFTGKKLEECYCVVKDLNKKSKWLREIQVNVPNDEILMEEYSNSDVFLREKHAYHELEHDPFKLSEEQEKAIENMFK